MIRIAETNPHPSPHSATIALATLRFPSSPDDALALAQSAVLAASHAHADILCFPECFVPGYRAPDRPVPPADPIFLDRAHANLAAAAARANLAVILGTERIVDSQLRATTLVIDRDGSLLGFQDKVQLAPQEESTYTPGLTRQVFHSGDLTFGIAICHEGWRYPETVRWAVRHGAQVVFHPFFHAPDPNPPANAPTTFAAPTNLREHTMLTRAAENTCYFASVNYAFPHATTTSAIIAPDGTVLAYQPYAEEGLLLADLDLTLATGLFAHRYKAIPAEAP